MLNLRTIVLSIGLVLILILSVPLVAARTEVVSDPASDPVSLLDHQDRYDTMSTSDPVIVLGHQDRYDKMNKAPIPSYRSQFGECFDVSIRELAACRDASQAEPSSIDECFDVSIGEIASCRNASQDSTR